MEAKEGPKQFLIKLERRRLCFTGGMEYSKIYIFSMKEAAQDELLRLSRKLSVASQIQKNCMDYVIVACA
ncbi:hypothetical protein [Halobacillus karajensis]|uniref:hypothetical protein n=1 Tax=Halobacillus karajensis TaxID=195088 RepID=UPI001114B2D0|nr:hypothetical protein [Halobacillus karajensis]